MTELKDVTGIPETVMFLLAYAVLSVTTYWEQLKKLTKKQFLDENLLMIIATAGAFAVGRHKEAVAAMLFYQAGKLVEDAGLKGISVGGAQVSSKHAGFVINAGGATPQDIVDLMHLVQNTVYDKTGVMLEPEVRIIDDKYGRN